MAEIYLCGDKDYYEIVKEGSRFRLRYLILLEDGSLQSKGFLTYYPTTKKELIARLTCSYNKVIRL